jgi:hypothetical protein
MSARTRRTLAGALDRDLRRARGSAVVFATYLDHDLDRDRVIHVARHLDRTLNSARALDLDRGRDRVLDLARDLERASHLAQDFVRELDNNFVHTFERDHLAKLSRNLARDVDRACTSTSTLVYEFDQVLVPNHTSAWIPGEQRRTAPSARRLLRGAVRMLPLSNRARYAEELGSELTEIALAGGGHRVQMAYAARQVTSAVQLRRELKSPQRRSAAP